MHSLVTDDTETECSASDLQAYFDLILLKIWPFSHTLFLLDFPANSNLTMEGPTAGYCSVLTVVSLCTVSRSDALTFARLLELFTRILGACHLEIRSGQ